MLALAPKQQWLIAGLLLVAMLLTRSHLLNHLQDASWAIFFLAGFYLRSYLGFPVFMGAAFLIDIAVISITGMDNFCLTLAYAFMVPAYFALWGAGRWFAGHYQYGMPCLLKLGLAAVAGTLVAFVISNAGFYAFSGHFTEMAVAEFVTAIRQYLPMYLQTTLFYLMAATLIHVAVWQVKNTRSDEAV